ncbi:MAG: winged helix-turn-helix domain-containing protein, partial [Pseudomonadota bacterium]
MAVGRTRVEEQGSMVDSTYAFLDFELGPRSLTRCGKSVAVRPKTFATLVYLVTHRDRVVSKDELLEAAWPDVYVHDQAVFQSISELRSVFAPLDCIETVRGLGYRWKLALDTEHPPARPSRPLRRLLVAAAAVAAVAVVGVWNTASEPTAATVVVNPDIGTSLSDRIEDAAPGMTQ